MHTVRSLVIAGALTGIGLGVTTSDVVADEARAEAVVLETDFRGKPPFKRQRVSAASQEVSAPARAASTRVDFRGAPPYKRHGIDTAPVERAEFARFEASEAEASPRRTRRGPPGKLTSRR
ncbi:MAG: hypothetical protein AAF545_04525 [Pseudomonadota bacterium]